MELNNLKKPKGSTHLPKRVGLGIGSGMGKTSTRGQKGQGARQGQKVPLGFEGGNFPIYRKFDMNWKYITISKIIIAELNIFIF